MLRKKEPAKYSRKKLRGIMVKDESFSNSNGNSLEEPRDLDDAYEEELLTKSSLYNNLLSLLGSKSEKNATQQKRRQREEEGGRDMFESSSLHEEGDDSEDGSSSSEQEVLSDVETDAMQQSDEEGSEVDPNLENELEKISSFSSHLSHNLTNEVIEKISRGQPTFRWDMPAVDFPMSKWAGSGEPILQERTDDLASCLKQKLYKHWLDINKASESNNFNSYMQNFFTLCNTYRDIMHCNKRPFYLKGNKEDSNIMDAYILHALNHIYGTRDLIIKNDAKLAKNQESKLEEVICGGAFIDQGFTRPKVLFLLPLASIAFRVVKRLVELTPLHNKANVEHFKRFFDEFGADAIDDEEDEESGSSKSHKPAKPADYQALFGGNNNDHFMLGIKFTKRNVKLYSDFYSSDIIVASPLGLVTKIGEAEVEKEKDVDYLSSIEVLIIDHADVIAMQNWSHAKTVVEQLNRTPSKQHGTDVMRIRQWYLEGHSRFYRQTIMLSSFVNPEMNALFSRLCMNYKGKIKLVSQHKGVLPKILLQVRQIYERFDATSVDDVDDARLEYFCKKGGTMLFISSYFEFVRIRNFLKSQEASHCLLGEYTKPRDISRARIWFFEGKRKIMLYTERAHFYHRYKIRGIQNLIMYSLPEEKEFYPEIINMLDESKAMVCHVLFSRFDQLKLERIVGTTAAKRMLSSDKSIFAFC